MKLLYVYIVNFFQACWENLFKLTSAFVSANVPLSFEHFKNFEIYYTIYYKLHWKLWSPKVYRL